MISDRQPATVKGGCLSDRAGLAKQPTRPGRGGVGWELANQIDRWPFNRSLMPHQLTVWEGFNQKPERRKVWFGDRTVRRVGCGRRTCWITGPGSENDAGPLLRLSSRERANHRSQPIDRAATWDGYASSQPVKEKLR